MHFDTGELTQLRRVRDQAQSGEARRLREDAGLSLTEVAKAIGVTASAVSQWESGRRRPRGIAALKYAAVLASLEVA